MGRPDDEEEFEDEMEEEWEEDDEELEDSDDIEESEEEEEVEYEEVEEAEEEIQTESTTLVSPDTIPLSLAVEIGRLKLTAKQLMSLQPGSMIEVNIDPEAGLDLVANGACIGKGELIRVGDVLGVRVMEIG